MSSSGRFEVADLANVWPDAYLAALASVAGLSVATLDRAFASLPGVDVACLLSP